MAGVEKCCEYSNEYPGYLMYGYKHNLIQIMPKYRKLFRGKDHTLYIFKPKLKWEGKGKYGGLMDYDPDEMNHWTPPFKDEEEFKEWYAKKYHSRLAKEYWYVLEVPELQGKVKGKYLNWSTELPTVKRKIKRLLRARKLNIQYIDKSYHEWRKDD